MTTLIPSSASKEALVGEICNCMLVFPGFHAAVFVERQSMCGASMLI
jgi:hypothetical protein